MKRSLFLMLTATVLITAMAVPAAAEYVACLSDGEHAMSDWVKIAENEDGSVVYERVCSKCGYRQKGFGGSDSSAGVATTRGLPSSENLAVTTSLDQPSLIAPNPSTGAIA